MEQDTSEGRQEQNSAEASGAEESSAQAETTKPAKAPAKKAKSSKAKAAPESVKATREELPETWAVIRSGGKQYRIAAGDTLLVERFDYTDGEQISLNEVLLLQDKGTLQIGQPLVTGAAVKATPLGEVKGPKTVSLKKRRRKGSKVKRGHRQEYIKLRIDSIAA